MVYSISYHLRKLRGASKCDKSIKTEISNEDLLNDVIYPNFDPKNANYHDAIFMLRSARNSREFRESGIVVKYSDQSKGMVYEADEYNSITPLTCAIYLFIMAYFKTMILLGVMFTIGNYYILRLYRSIQLKTQALGFYREIFSVLQNNLKLRVKELKKIIATKELPGYKNIEKIWPYVNMIRLNDE